MKFNRNILYCKYFIIFPIFRIVQYLIETFCIVNSMLVELRKYFEKSLIETFCIVNQFHNLLIRKANVDLIETFCIVNVKLFYTSYISTMFNRNILYCKF